MRVLTRGEKFRLSITWLSVFAAALLGLLGTVSPATAGDEMRELRILNWSEYLDPALVKAFEERFDVDVKEFYYESDAARDQLLAQSGGTGYDIVIVDGPAIARYRARNWLTPISLRFIPNLQHVDSRWLGHTGTRGYAVPYFWGSIGIAYRADLVPEPITRWRDVLEPADALRGRIVMIRDSRDLVSAGLLALGYSPNTTNPDELRDAEDLLAWQQPYVRTYSYVDVTEASALVTGEAWAAMVYNGDAVMLQEHHENIVFVAPEEGTVLWVDYLVVMSASMNKELAFQFINFLNEPANAAQLAEYVYHPTPNRAAEALLPQSFREDATIYPSEEILADSEFYRDLRPQDLRRYISIRSNVAR